MTQFYPLLFQSNLHTVVWGGHRLEPWKNLDPSGDPVGESWEVSAVPGSPSLIANGRFAGQSLPELIRNYPKTILGKKVAIEYRNQLPLLVKFIDAERDLSIQVHPNDEMAQRVHGKFGKTEMWYVIDAQPGAFLYAGFSQQLTPEQYKEHVANGTITQVMARHEVHPGDVFFLPAGRVHAICGGILLAEVQQSSDVTYRIFDYNRPGMDGKPRELHTELAAQALDFTVLDEYRTEYFSDADRANHCIDSPFFSVRVVDIHSPKHRNLLKYDSFIITMCLRGDCLIKLRTDSLGLQPDNDEHPTQIHLHEGYSCLIPAAIADYDVIPLGDSTQLLDAYIDNMDRSLAGKLGRFLHLTKR